MTKLRETFEKWMSGAHGEKSLVRYPIDATSAWPGAYKDETVELAWESWQTAWYEYLP